MNSFKMPNLAMCLHALLCSLFLLSLVQAFEHGHQRNGHSQRSLESQTRTQEHSAPHSGHSAARFKQAQGGGASERREMQELWILENIGGSGSESGSGGGADGVTASEFEAGTDEHGCKFTKGTMTGVMKLPNVAKAEAGKTIKFGEDPKGYSITSYDAATGTIVVDGTPPPTTETTKFTVSRKRGDSNADGYCADDAVCSNAGDLGAVCSKCTNECRCSPKFTGLRCSTEETEEASPQAEIQEMERMAREPMSVKEQINMVSSIGEGGGDFVESAPDIVPEEGQPFKGIDFLGIGYDIVRGNPRGGEKNLIDPGFRQPVVDLEIQGQARDLRSGIPKHGYTWPENTCEMASETSMQKTSTDYASELAVDASLGVGYDGAAASVAFQASYGMQSFKREIEDKESETYSMASYCLERMYGLNDVGIKPMKSFERSVVQLPRVTSPLCNHAVFDDSAIKCVTISSQGYYLKAVKDAGVGLLSTITLAQATITATIKKSQAWELAQEKKAIDAANRDNNLRGNGTDSNAPAVQALEEILGGIAGTSAMWWAWDSSANTFESLGIREQNEMESELPVLPVYLHIEHDHIIMSEDPGRCVVEKEDSMNEAHIRGKVRIQQDGNMLVVKVADNGASTQPTLVLADQEENDFSFNLNRIPKVAEKLWYKHFNRYGTHYIDTLHTGGRLVTEVTFTSNQMSELTSAGTDVAASVAGAYGPVSGSASVAVATDSEKTAQSAVKEGKTKITVFGGKPPAADAQSSTAFQAWSTTVNGNPMPISYTLKPLCDASPLMDHGSYDLMSQKFAQFVVKGAEADAAAAKLQNPVASTELKKTTTVKGSSTALLKTANEEGKLMFSTSGRLAIIFSGRVLWDNGVNPGREGIATMELKASGNLEVYMGEELLWESITCAKACEDSITKMLQLLENGELQIIDTDDKLMWDSGSSDRVAPTKEQNFVYEADADGVNFAVSEAGVQGNNHCLIRQAINNRDEYCNEESGKYIKRSYRMIEKWDCCESSGRGDYNFGACANHGAVSGGKDEKGYHGCVCKNDQVYSGNCNYPDQAPTAEKFMSYESQCKACDQAILGWRENDTCEKESSHAGVDLRPKFGNQVPYIHKRIAYH